MRSPSCYWVCAVIGLVAVANGVSGAELPLHQIVQTLFTARPGTRIDFSGKDLSLLDLSGVDFKRANLAGANLLGDDLTGANLSDVNLEGAKLDRTTLAQANFTGANLSQATLFDAVGSLTFEVPAANAPTFVGANLSGARIFARLSRADFRNANLSDAHLGTERNQFKMPKQTDLSGALFGGANLERADVTGANLIFANMVGANLKDAILIRADLSNADLSGAHLAGADFTDANIYGVVFRNATGVKDVKGLDRARNVTRQSFEVRSVCAWPNGSKTTPLRIRLRRLALPSWLLLRHRPVAAILERAKHRLHVGRRRIYFPKPSRPIVGL